MVQRAPVRRCRFIGDQGTITWDGITERIDYFRIGEAEWRAIDRHEAVDRNQTYLDELSHFLEAVQHGQGTVDAAEAFRTLAIVDAARTSMERGIAVEPRSHA